ncbi:Short-chain dehydrogenase TIC 32, chloroplastic [Cytospora mali]|uniref:Short-chain dehydrogenase TIC 32, chloroplastic n=1 Tax=Cytospora mali TaxID=578113 RepID=A0A194VM36_CYTMA|nr:Short-chain dehydrogenase TIC 32, chloroplastic [Valsa mali]
MPIFDGTTNSEKVIQNFASRIKGRTFVITGAAADFDQVRSASETIRSAAPRIVVLINNAGINKASNNQLSANYLGHFLLTSLLMHNLLAAAPDARVVNVSSHGYRISPFRFNDWNFSGGKPYNEWTAYGQAKTAQTLFTIALTKKFKDRGVTSTVVHPGNIFTTGLATQLTMEDLGKVAEIAKRETGVEWYFEPPQQKSLTQGAATHLYAALDPNIPAKSPAYFSNCQIQEPLEYDANPEATEKLWELSEELVKQKFE